MESLRSVFLNYKIDRMPSFDIRYSLFKNLRELKNCAISPSKTIWSNYFQPADQETSNVEILIIEADNDPLVEKTLREMLKTTYPFATVKTLQGAGHFPYLNRAEKYTKILEEFFDDN